MLSYFSPQAGGLMCGSCASSVPGAELVSTGEVAWLRALMSMTFDALMVEKIDPHTAAFLLGLSHVWAATHTDQRSVRWNSCWVGDDAQARAACGNIPTCWYLDLGCSLHRRLPSPRRIESPDGDAKRKVKQ